MQGFESTRDAPSQVIVAAILVGVFALLAADRVHRVLVPIGAVALVWLISYFSPFKLISFEAAQRAVEFAGGRTVRARRRCWQGESRQHLWQGGCLAGAMDVAGKAEAHRGAARAVRT